MTGNSSRSSFFFTFFFPFFFSYYLSKIEITSFHPTILYRKSMNSSSISSSPTKNSSLLLKDLLSISNNSKTIEVIKEQQNLSSKIEIQSQQHTSQSPTSITKKTFLLESKNSRSNQSIKNSNKQLSPPTTTSLFDSPLLTPTTSLSSSSSPPSSNSFYAGSDFMNSPDPLTIPIPNFDDDDEEDENIFPTSSNSLSFEDKTSTLRRILQVT